MKNASPKLICLILVCILVLMGLPSLHVLWLSGLVVSTLGIRGRGPVFDSRVMPLFHLVATLGRLFTHTASAVSQLQETGVQEREFLAPKCW